MSIEPALVDRLHANADAARWALPRDIFAEAVERSAGKAFAGRAASGREVERYLATLHLADLALACACALGHEAAWDHFVREHRPVLYRAADALDRSGGARELADALYADLYGVAAADGTRRSLFRYYHGRSSLATWLRAVLSQRHVDALRVSRRTRPLPEDETLTPALSAPEPDPDRHRLRQAMHAALGAAIALLAAQDRFRLRSYYVAGLTLSQIGRLTGEHEATVSRHLKPHTWSAARGDRTSSPGGGPAERCRGRAVLRAGGGSRPGRHVRPAGRVRDACRPQERSAGSFYVRAR